MNYTYLSRYNESTYKVLCEVIEYGDNVSHMNNEWRSIYGMRKLFKQVESGEVRLVGLCDDDGDLYGVGFIVELNEDKCEVHVLTLGHYPTFKIARVQLSNMFKDFGYREIEAWIPENNRAARYCAVGAGMKFDGKIENNFVDINGKQIPCRHYVYERVK